MVEVSEKLKEAFQNGGQKDIKLEFSNGTILYSPNVVAESLTFEQSICEEEQLVFGKVNAGRFSIKVMNGGVPFKETTLKVTIIAHETTESGSVIDYPFVLGVFKVYEDVLTDDRLYRQITAYDFLYEHLQQDVSGWYNKLAFPMTLKSFRDSFFNYIGITQESTTLINDNISISRTTDQDTLSGQVVLEAICELNATFGHLTYDNKFRYVNIFKTVGLYPAEDIYPSRNLYPKRAYDAGFSESDYVLGSFVWSDYSSRRITGVEIKDSKDDVGVFVGTRENVYMIGSNFLIYDVDNAVKTRIATSFLGMAKPLNYTPARAKTRCKPWVEIGDMVGIQSKGRMAIFPVLHRTMTGITALYDAYEAKGKEYYAFNPNSISAKVSKIQRQIEVESAERIEADEAIIEDLEEFKEGESTKWVNVYKDLDGIRTEVGKKVDNETYVSYIEQTAQEISSRVTYTDYNGVEIASLINQSASKISISASAIDLTGITTLYSGGSYSGTYCQWNRNELRFYGGGYYMGGINVGSSSINLYGNNTIDIGGSGQYVDFTARELYWYQGSGGSYSGRLATEPWVEAYVDANIPSNTTRSLSAQNLSLFSDYLSLKEV